MTTFLIASALLALQTPAQPKVRLPEGWKVEYGPGTGSGRGALVGPSGAEISFPDYLSTGTMAEVVAEMDSRTLLVHAVVGECPVHVAIDSEGLLAVSFPGGDRFSLGRFDFWRRVKSAREVVETLSIVLTRIEAERALRRRVGAKADRVAVPEPSSRQAPFRGLRFRNPFQSFDDLGRNAYRRGIGGRVPRGDLRERRRGTTYGVADARQVPPGCGRRGPRRDVLSGA